MCIVCSENKKKYFRNNKSDIEISLKFSQYFRIPYLKDEKYNEKRSVKIEH